MKDRNYSELKGELRLAKLDEQYDLFLLGKITGEEFNMFVKTNITDSRKRGDQN